LEKPIYDYQVSMGVYVFEPHALSFIPKGHRFDLPDLIRALIEAGEPVQGYAHSGYWLDIGRPEDYRRAQDDFLNIQARLLGKE
jgi:NDP-sugar pyrophosphorylase family protein